MSEQPPPVPPQPSPPTAPGPVTRQTPGGALEDYNKIAETVGLMPTLRMADNVIQAAVVLGCTALGALIGYLRSEWLGAALGGAGAMIASALVSGLVLMVLGWVRAARKRKG